MSPTARSVAACLIALLPLVAAGCGSDVEDGPVATTMTPEEIEAHDAAIEAARNAPEGTVDAP